MVNTRLVLAVAGALTLAGCAGLARVDALPDIDLAADEQRLVILAVDNVDSAPPPRPAIRTCCTPRAVKR